MNIKNQEWVESRLELLDFVEWDRFTEGDWNGQQSLSVYGWIDRDDEYKDFVLMILWPESEEAYYSTSSEEYTTEICRRLFDHDPDDEHNECIRVEDTFDVPNAIELHQDTTLLEYAAEKGDN